MKDVKSKLYPGVIVLLSLTLLAVLFSRFQITVSREPAPETSTSPIAPPSPVASPSVSIAPSPSVTPSPSPVVTPSPAPAPASAATLRRGNLRVSNQTDHPVRVALLPQQSGSSSFGKPVHWDFAPQEGSGKGLRLSLPDSDLSIREGDIVVAFAQDGTRRYWGPFVVGKTDLPTWEANGWQIVLQL